MSRLSCSGSHSCRRRHKHETTAHFTPKLKVLLFPATLSPNTEPPRRTCLLHVHLDLCCQYRVEPRWCCNQAVLVEQNHHLSSLMLLLSYNLHPAGPLLNHWRESQAFPTNQPESFSNTHTNITSLWLHGKQEVPQNGQYQKLKMRKSCKVQSENENVSKTSWTPI